MMHLCNKTDENNGKARPIADCRSHITRRCATCVAEFLARFHAAKRTFLVLDCEWCGEVSEALDGRLNSTRGGNPRSRKGTRSFRIYLYNTYEACIQSSQTSCRHGLANPFPSSSPKASKERSFESPSVNMGFGGKEDDAVTSLRLWLKI